MNTHDIYKIVFKEYPDILDVKQLSKMLGVSTKTVYQLIREGTLASLKVGREFRVLKIEVMKYMNLLRATDQIENS